MKATKSTILAVLLGISSSTEAAPGFFRIENRGDDRWELVDPQGKDTFLRGIDHVTYRGHWCTALQKFPHLEVMKRKFPNPEDWRTNTVDRLTDWGFTALGAGSDPELRHRGLLHTEFLSMGDEWAFQKDENYWICPNEGRPCSAFPNVFHPNWARHCEEVAAMKCTPQKDDRQLFGYFIDNELAWWGRSPQWGLSDTGLFDEAMKRPEGHAAHEAALALLKERGLSASDRIPSDVKREFLRRAAERYFSVSAAAIRKADPNHLVLGARFAGINGAHPIVWEISGKYCDLVTFNCYPWADIDRDLVLNDAWSRAEPVYDAFRRVYDLVKKPLIITEWSFPAFDSGLPCLNGAGQRFQTQTERTEATELFAKAMLAMPFVIGYDYFMWVDEPALGISPAFPEDSNYGLINENGDAYPEITGMFRRLHGDLAVWRQGAVTVRKNGGYSVGDGHVRFQGRIGNGPVFAEVARDGVRYGTFNLMLETRDFDGSAGWPSVNEIKSAVRKGGALELVAAGGDGERRFELSIRVSSPDARGAVVAEVLEIRNIGSAPLEIERLMLGAYADFAREAKVERSKVMVWKAPSDVFWVAEDGRRYGVETASPATDTFWYFVDGSGAHPDACFRPWTGRLKITPGDAVRLRDTWAKIIADRK